MQLPEDFLKQTESIFGDCLWHSFLSAMNVSPSVSVRLNTMKTSNMIPCEELQNGIVPWCDNGYYLKERPNFTFDPLFHAGLYYVQEAASMFITQVLRQYLPETPVKILDLCAAPGGKSTASRCVLPAGSLLVCNEPIKARAQVLMENMVKQGCPDVIVTNNYAKEIARSGLVFDLILADVPCSGEGMFRKDSVAVTEWSSKNVENCCRLQREIIADIWPSLREGGLLIYSTCTFNVHEDEENVRYIMENLGADVIPVNVEADWNITGSLLQGFNEPVYRFIPGRSRGEGLFVAVLRKVGSSALKSGISRCGREKKKKQTTSGENLKCNVSNLITDTEHYQQNFAGSVISLIPKAWYADYEVASRALNVISAGVKVGEIKGKNFIPAHSLAMSVALNRTAFHEVELEYADALRYLQRDQVTMPIGTPLGYILVTYRGIPLGFVKNIGNRANNLYPAEWRIRSQHIPEGISEVLE